MYVVLGYLPVDGMTAKAYKFNHSFLIETATKIVNEVKELIELLIILL